MFVATQCWHYLALGLLCLLVSLESRSLCSALGAQPSFTHRHIAARLNIPTILADDDSTTKKHVGKKIIAFLPPGVRNGLASALAAAVVKLTLQPFDTIKTVQQMNNYQMGLLKTTLSFIEKRGMWSLWAGAGITVLGSAPSVAVYFGVFNSCKVRFAAALRPDQRPLAIASAAIVGNTIASFMRVPYEVLKQRLQMARHDNLWEAIIFATSAEQGGFLGLFSGGRLVSQIVRDVPYAVITGVCYEFLQGVVNKYIDRDKIDSGECMTDGSTGSSKNNEGNAAAAESTTTTTSTAATAARPGKRRTYQDAVCGSMAGGFSTFLTTPMDVIKTRLMSGGDKYEYTSVGNAIQRILQEEGMLSFFRGTSSRLLHKIPANGLFYLFYEFFRSVLDVDEYYQ